jgi:hypothetical protein
MYIVPIAWLYVVMMMAVAEASNSNGSLLGAVITFVLYGLAPVGLLLYFIGTPARKRAIKTREANEARAAMQATPPASAESGDAQALLDPDGSGHAPAAPQSEVVASVRKEP